MVRNEEKVHENNSAKLIKDWLNHSELLSPTQFLRKINYQVNANTHANIHVNYINGSSEPDKFSSGTAIKNEQETEKVSQDRRNQLTLKVRQLAPSLACDGPPWPQSFCCELHKPDKSRVFRWFLQGNRGWLMVPKPSTVVPRPPLYASRQMEFSFGQPSKRHVPRIHPPNKFYSTQHFCMRYWAFSDIWNMDEWNPLDNCF